MHNKIGETPMPTLDQEIEAYEHMRQDLEAHQMGKWVLVYDTNLAGIYDSFEVAAEDAVKRFGRGPYLIRQVGETSITLPASVMYYPDHGADKVRV